MNIIYVHVCCINNYKEVFMYLIQCIKDSGLYDDIQEIRCCILGEYDPAIFTDEKIKIHAVSPDISLYEVFTINRLYEDCKTEDMNVLYLHTKGITKPNNLCILQWVQYLCYFNIYKYKNCLEMLYGHDTVGVNLYREGTVHYSGNFWWATSNYIRTLEPCQYTCYNSPEFWLTEKNKGIYYNLWTSHVNHYHTLYPPKLYIQPTEIESKDIL
jgi:hypothetical protein